MFETEVISKLDKLINLLSSNTSWLQNLVSTVIGVILGTFLTLVNQKSGTLKCYIVSHKLIYSKLAGGTIDKNEQNNEPNSCKFDLIVDFQNTTQHNLGLRDICLEIIHNNKEIEIYLLKDVETHRSASYGIAYDLLETLNIESNCIIRKKLLFYFDKDQIVKLKKKGTAYFVYTNERNKIKRIKIFEILESH